MPYTYVYYCVDILEIVFLWSYCFVTLSSAMTYGFRKTPFDKKINIFRADDFYIVFFFLFFVEYGRTCSDIGCLNNEVCVMQEEPCTYSRTECGR